MSVYVSGHHEVFDPALVRGLENPPAERPYALVRSLAMSRRGFVKGWYRTLRDATREGERRVQRSAS